jgi:chemotaxis protein MotD
VSSAQPLTSGMLAPSGSIRPQDAIRIEKSVTSFRDALDSASRSSTNPPQSSSSETSRASDKRDLSAQHRSDARDNRKADNRDDKNESEGSEADAASATEQQAVLVSDLSAVLAALGGASAGQRGEGGAEFDTSLAALQNAVADPALIPTSGEALDKGPALPGQTGEAGELLDAAKLLALLKAPATSEESGSDVVAETVEVAATVLGQETHLAIEMPAETSVQMSEAQSANPKMAAQAAEVPLEASADRLRDRNAGTEASDPREGVSTQRSSAATQDTRTTVGGAFAEQGIAGQDGQQQDGNGSSSGGSQQSTTNVFASMVSDTRSQGVDLVDTQESAAFDPLSEQIAAEVRAELRADGMGETSSDGVVKVLHLQLKPANLGAVTVRIALKDNAISIHMEAQHRDTLAVIERERDALAGALSSAGYSVDGITATTQTDLARTSGVQTGFGDQGASPQGQAAQGRDPGASSGEQGRQERGSFGGQSSSGGSDGKDIRGNSVRRESEGLYV